MRLEEVLSALLKQLWNLLYFVYLSVVFMDTIKPCVNYNKFTSSLTLKIYSSKEIIYKTPQIKTSLEKLLKWQTLPHT